MKQRKKEKKKQKENIQIEENDDSIYDEENKNKKKPDYHEQSEQRENQEFIDFIPLETRIKINEIIKKTKENIKHNKNIKKRDKKNVLIKFKEMLKNYHKAIGRREFDVGRMSNISYKVRVEKGTHPIDIKHYKLNIVKRKYLDNILDILEEMI